jgi:hypothetical protein
LETAKKVRAMLVVKVVKDVGGRVLDWSFKRVRSSI